ncbi:MAG: host-nuclease inhibitor Gam family protein [Actinomycetota bacterium]|nr:host-nuclease inhibitor Gam family protein [Actinomycetota bacterium]
MARKKVVPTMKAWADVDVALRRIGFLRIEFDCIEDAMNGEIMRAKTSAAKKVEPLLAEIARLEAEMQVFTEAHREGLGAKQSLQLTFGTVSFRKSTRLIISSVKKAVAQIREKLGASYLHIKESPDKDALDKLDDKTLASVGVKRKSGETFGYEVDYKKISEEAACNTMF